MADGDLRPRAARLSATSAHGWDEVAHAVGMGQPSFTALLEAIGVFLAEHNGELWRLTEAGQRALIVRAFDIDAQRRERRPR